MAAHCRFIKNASWAHTVAQTGIFYVVCIIFSVNTKVEVRFNVDEAEWIPDWAKSKLKEQVNCSMQDFFYIQHL